MQALQNEKVKNPLVVNLFCWICSHMGIRGNEQADLTAKSALSQDILPFKIPYSDFKPLINVLLYDDAK